MRKLILLIGITVLLVACGSGINSESYNNDVYEDKFKVIHESANNTEQELYVIMLNSIMNEFDENELFDLDEGINMYNALSGVYTEDKEAAYEMKESLVEAIPEKEKQDLYSEFADRILSMEDTFKHVKWE